MEAHQASPSLAKVLSGGAMAFSRRKGHLKKKRPSCQSYFKLFLNFSLSTGEIENRAQSLHLFDTLKTDPEGFHKHMVKYIYPTIGGFDHEGCCTISLCWRAVAVQILGSRHSAGNTFGY